MVDVIPLKKWPGGVGEMEAGDKIPAQFLELPGQAAAYRNKIINGKFERAQRGASFAAAHGYTLDRWEVLVGGGGVVTASQQIDAPNNEFRTSLRIVVTTADISIASSDYAVIAQKVEGYNARDLIGRTFTLSFWVRSSKTGVHCVAFRNSTPDRSYVIEYTVTTANTWEYKSVTVDGGLIIDGTWDWTNGKGVDVVFALLSGSNFHTAAGAWQSGNYIATANQVNCLDAVGNTFAVTGVQLEAGPAGTSFEHLDIGTELALCQRYYEVASTALYNNNGTGRATNGANIVYVPWKVSKRADPTVVLQGTFSTNVWSVTPSLQGVNGMRIVVVQDLAGAMDYGATVYADAELR